MPIDRASSGLRPVYDSDALYPRTPKFATSLPGLYPSAIVLTRPIFPDFAIRSIYGVFANSKGVLLPISGIL